MSFVVDASVAIKWFVPEPHHEQARSLLYHCGGQLAAPDFILSEVANILWKKNRRAEIPQDQALEALNDLFDYFDAFSPFSALMTRALEFSIALNHPVYDCIYLACAEQEEKPLITADQRLINIVEAAAFHIQVQSLATYPPYTGPTLHG